MRISRKTLLISFCTIVVIGFVLEFLFSKESLSILDIIAYPLAYGSMYLFIYFIFSQTNVIKRNIFIFILFLISLIWLIVNLNIPNDFVCLGIRCTIFLFIMTIPAEQF